MLWIISNKLIWWIKSKAFAITITASIKACIVDPEGPGVLLYYELATIFFDIWMIDTPYLTEIPLRDSNPPITRVHQSTEWENLRSNDPSHHGWIKYVKSYDLLNVNFISF